MNCDDYSKPIQGYKQDVINIINIPSLVALGNELVLNTIK